MATLLTISELFAASKINKSMYSSVGTEPKYEVNYGRLHPGLGGGD